MRVAPVHVRRLSVSNEADFAGLLDHTNVVVVEVLIVVDFEVAPSEQLLVLNEVRIEFLVHIPTDKRLISRHQEVPLVKLEDNRLAEGWL